MYPLLAGEEWIRRGSRRGEVPALFIVPTLSCRYDSRLNDGAHFSFSHFTIPISPQWHME